MTGKLAAIAAAVLAATAAIAYAVGSSGLAGTPAILLMVAVGVGAMLTWTITARPMPQRRQGDIWELLTAELDRSRRRAHPVSLVAFSVDSAPDAARELRPVLRSMDHLQAVERDLIILLPEASRGEAESLVGRLRETVPALAGMTDCRIAVFPYDGVTERALRSRVEGRPYFAEPLGRVAASIELAREDAELGAAEVRAGRTSG